MKLVVGKNQLFAMEKKLHTAQTHTPNCTIFYTIHTTYNISKHRGPLFQAYIAKGPEGATISEFDVKVYPDTKIRLHFSTFKILPPSRDTCFLDSPHQCEEFEDSAGRSHGIEL